MQANPFTPTLDQILSPKKLEAAAYAIRSRAVGIDNEDIRAWRDDPKRLEALAASIVQGTYVPEPLQRIEVQKESGGTRPLGISSVRDKIVQKALHTALDDFFDATFSDKSYGYRRRKGTLNAIHRVQDFIRRGYVYAYKTDIDDFFETIPHDKLLDLLHETIADRRIVSLVELFLQNGSFRVFDYVEHHEGVHQGDALSPLLSNLYLDRMDRWLEARNVAFVRYADDFVLLFKNKKSRKAVVPQLQSYLETQLGLRLGDDKSYTASVMQEGFTFLGCRFHGEHVAIDNDRLQRKVSRLYAMAKKPWAIDRYVSELNDFIEGLQRYYLHIISPDSAQFSHLEEALADSAARRLARALDTQAVRRKKELLSLAERIVPLKPLDAKTRKRFAKTVAERAKTLAAADPAPQNSQKLAARKQRYAKTISHEAVVVADRFGASLGVAKNRITLKEKGKVVRSVPVKRCERIIVATKAASISSALVHLCAEHGIAVDFIDGDHRPYAAFYSHTQAYAKRTLAQLSRYGDPKMRLDTAMRFVTAKLKNQRNYLKYLDKHHRKIRPQIEKLRHIAAQAKHAPDIDTLMGFEGSGSALYWEALGEIVADKAVFAGRVTQGASDPVNSALNYGYAILYSEVQHALVRAGLALHVSYLHALDDGKPTLVFDFIEPFRAFTVDRTVFSMVNRDEPLRVDGKGRLTEASRRLVARNVLERLGSFTRHDGASKRMRNVVRDEAYAFARAVDAGEPYRPFIGRY